MTKNKTTLLRENDALRDEAKRLLRRCEVLEAELDAKKKALAEADAGVSELNKLVDSILIMLALSFGDHAEDGTATLALPSVKVDEALKNYDVKSSRTEDGMFGIFVTPIPAESEE